ncbi:ribosomal protein L23 [Hamiltosporidium tvaerminnensis]|uniref:Ribosomal protein L23 n=2 Tax=Hamiltosporidium TaxID=1176354 RepID=A0A4Q9LAX2_9MICR|nr:60S ribosomal protein L25 [Hamiltosporidium tvaerminnensis]TBT99563.1 ribosomal protein L23 [Hamiltosporidium magnivora]TBU02146.1 ribosomal protein L23 [Hamiltosporidium tvaerminnensis]TBU04949.1 ribosomal protein L23 [Hamiltosporidium magnivora]TBU05340.1 ribosomal protein L23 [Hamiltosporidium magnivora]
MSKNVLKNEIFDTSKKIYTKKNNKKFYKRVVPRSVDAPASEIIRYGLNNENAAKSMEKNNTMIFICDNRATKPQIKKAVEELYGTSVSKVRTLNTIQGAKKAYVRMVEPGEALRVASKAGIME